MDIVKTTNVNIENYYLPKKLFNNEKYKPLSLEAKVIYSFFLNKTVFSLENSLKDENGNLYVLFRLEEIAKLLDVSLSTVSRAIKALKKYDLINVVRQGLGKPNKIYLKSRG